VNRTNRLARVILFDWDGTLLDSFAADSAAYISMFAALGIPWGEREFALHYSPNWHRVYRAARLPRAKWEIADRLWMRAYQRQNPALLPGVRATLRKLRRHFRLGVVSSGSGWRVRKQLRAMDLRGYFGACVCGEDTLRRKPDPAALKLALKRLRASPEETIYVGDAPEDIQMARRAGVRAIGVLGPFPTAARLRASHPEAVLPSIGLLPRYLRVDPPLPGRRRR
jgi:HAD superfamily hydrolase (TIGR01509 family)